MRYLAIDYGKKRTGLAVCDPGEVVCSPLCVFKTGVDICDRVAKTAKQEQAQAYVIGLPLNMDGTEGFHINCGIRIQGGYFRSPGASPKHSFRLLFKGLYGTTRLRYPLFGEDAVEEKQQSRYTQSDAGVAGVFPYESHVT